MASSESMDDSFRTRIEKVFGSLASSQSSPLHPPWSLTDDEVEKREWNRDRDGSNRDDETPISSSFDGLFTKDRKILEKRSRSIRKELEDDLQDLDDDDDAQLGGGSSKQSFKRDDGDDRDEWEIRSSIGLDCTLDNEEEEDEFDKVAEGRENAGARLYMKDIADHGPYLNSHHVLSKSVHDARRDPRANHLAARIRLKEDEAAAEKFDSRFDKSVLNVEEPCIKASEGGSKLKSILKRKDNEAVKFSKRVRFDSACKDDCEEASIKHQDVLTGTPLRETKDSDDDSLSAKNTPKVPDYVLNPSKYTHYSFDSSCEINEESNSRACMDFLELVTRPKPIILGCKLEDASADLPKSVTFIPRKKASDAEAVNCSSEVKQNHEDCSKLSLTETGLPVGIAAGEAQQSEVSAMQEDEPDIDTYDMSAGSQKPGRHYRTKSRLEDPVS